MNINLATKPNDPNLKKYYMDLIKAKISEGINESKRDKTDYVIKITLEQAK